MARQRQRYVRKHKAHISVWTLILGVLCLILAGGLLAGSLVMNQRMDAEKKKTADYKAKLQTARQASSKLQQELEAKEAYIEEWDGVYHQLAQQQENPLPAETDQPQGVYESPYKEIHPDMQAGMADAKPAVSDQKVVHLTFDDGPSKYTGQVLEALDVYGIKATFFVTYTDNPELQKYYKEIVDRGHTIAVHTASHEYKTIYASVENYLEDFYKIYQLIYEQTGVKPVLFRYPGGSSSLNTHAAGPAIAEEMDSRGFLYFDWNVSCGDGSSRATEDSVLQSITAGVAKQQESVVLMHDTRTPTVNILPEVLRQLSESGCIFQPLDQNTKKVQFYHKKL